jgi:protein TonB
MRGFPYSPIALALAVSTGVHVAVLSLPDLRALLHRPRPARESMRVTLVEPPPAPLEPRELPAAGPDATPTPVQSGSGAAPAAHSSIPLDTPDPRYRGYFQVVKGMIARHWDYPAPARARGETGEVVLEFSLDRRGGLRQVRVEASSGNRLLDEAAREAVRRAAPDPPCPPEIGRDPFLVSAQFVYGG